MNCVPHEQESKKKGSFKKFQYRGVDLEKLLSMKAASFIELLPSRLRRRFKRGITRKHTTLLQKLRKAKKEAKIAPGETTARPPTIKVRAPFYCGCAEWAERRERNKGRRGKVGAGRK